MGCVLCLPQRDPRSGASRVWGWGDPRARGLSGRARGSEKGGILLFQAIFAALGLCCLGGKDAGSGCCCFWQLLRSSAAGFPWLPNPKPVELSVCTDRGKPCCEGSSLEGSRKIPVLLLVSVWLFGFFFPFIFFSSLKKRKKKSFFKTILNTCLLFICSVLRLVGNSWKNVLRLSRAVSLLQSQML